MKPKLVKVSAVPIILGGLSWIAAEAAELIIGLTMEVLYLNFLAFFGLAIGIWGSHFGQAPKAGKARRASLIGAAFLSIAFLTFSVGSLTLLSAGDITLDLAGGNSELGEKTWVFAGFLLLMLGAPLFGISVVKARVYPVWVGLVLVLAPLVSAITAIIGLFSSLFTNLNNAILATCFVTMAGYVLSGRAALDDPHGDGERS